MQSGLKWNEDYGNRSDVTLMLHCESDMGHYAFDQPLDSSCWIITGIILPEQPILSVISSASSYLMIHNIIHLPIPSFLTRQECLMRSLRLTRQVQSLDLHICMQLRVIMHGLHYYTRMMGFSMVNGYCLKGG